MTTYLDSFGGRAALGLDSHDLDFYRLDAIAKKARGDIALLPYSLRVLLENLLRNEDGETVTQEDILAVANWVPQAQPSHEIAFRPVRVLLQDFTGVPAVVDLAAMREALIELKGDPSRINPLQPVDLVIDHSVQIDAYGSKQAFDRNIFMEFERNKERYRFLKWGQSAFKGLRVVPPDTGIVHQVNLEYLARVVFQIKRGQATLACPDSLVGTDSHTTMVNALGVLGWGVGGIEAEAAMLGQPISMLVPQVVGFELTQRLQPGVTATDLVLTVVQMLRQKNVVGKFVEFFGDGLSSLSLPDRATIANMAPEYGATVGFFPVDEQTLAYLRLTGRDPQQIVLVERYCKEQRLFRAPTAPSPRYTDTLQLDLSQVTSSLAGPRRPQDRVDLRESKAKWRNALEEIVKASSKSAAAKPKSEGHKGSIEDAKSAASELKHGSVVIAAITSCTNTSNPAVLMAAGLLAKNAVQKGLASKPWVKTSFAPGSQVVTDYLTKAGCSTLSKSSVFTWWPMDVRLVSAIQVPCQNRSKNESKRTTWWWYRFYPATATLKDVSTARRANYLASPPLVVAYALAGAWKSISRPIRSVKIATENRSICATSGRRNRRFSAIDATVDSEMFARRYSQVTQGSAVWQSIDVPKGEVFDWQFDSTYIGNHPSSNRFPCKNPKRPDIANAGVGTWGFGDHRSHLSCRIDRVRQPGCEISGRAGRYTQGLQLLWQPSRQSRGHDAGDLCQHPFTKSIGSGQRGWCHAHITQRRNCIDLRRGHALQIRIRTVTRHSW